jgi:hypothetical protein
MNPIFRVLDNRFWLVFRFIRGSAMEFPESLEAQDFILAQY